MVSLLIIKTPLKDICGQLLIHFLYKRYLTTATFILDLQDGRKRQIRYLCMKIYKWEIRRTRKPRRFN